MLRHAIGLLALLSISSIALFAQTSGSITGEVLDQSKASIGAASVTAVNTATGQKRQASTDSAGRYTIPDVAVGVYTVTAEQKGFQQQVSQNVSVGVAQQVTLNFSLAAGTITQVVEVTADATPVAEAGGATFDNKSINDLPINGRDYARFSLLTPGSSASSNYIAMLTFNGGHSIHNQFQIDGVDATRVDQPYMANGFERGARLLTGSLETIEEFRAQTSTYAAEYGRAAGSYINIASKSGGNQMHGTLLEFFRNNAMDARNFFNTKPSPQAEFRYNNFGGNLSGKIIKDKTFYFVNYEGSRQRVGITGSGTTPSALLRSEVLAKSPVLLAILNQFPVGTSSSSNPLIDNYTTVATSKIREDTGSVKIDHSLSDTNHMYVRVNVNDSHVFGPLFGVTSTALGLNDFQNVPIRTSNVAIHDEQIFSSRFLNEFLIGMQRWGSKIISDEPTPLISITGLTVSPGTRGRSKSNNTSYQLSDTMSFTQGAHNFKWGYQMYRVQLDRQSINTTSITYTSIQDFINNSAYSASQSVGNPGTATRGYQYGAFAQDTWHLRQNVTVDYGLRWDYDAVPFDPGNHQQTFSLATDTLAPAGTKLYNPNRTDFSPRLGVAWQVSNRLMIRTGYGIFYQAYPTGLGANIVTNNLPGNTSLTRAQIPSLSYPLAPYLSQGALALPSVYGYDSNRHDTYAHQWNFTTEWALTRTMGLSVAYVGDHGLNLRRALNINYPNAVTKIRPIAGYSNVNIEYNNGENSYSGLQTTLKQTLHSGVQYSLNYTWAHAIDDVQDYGIWSTAPQDNNNLKGERGNSSDDIRHTVSYSVLYDLPVGKGKRLLGGTQGLLGTMVSGWQLASVGLIRTGIAATVGIGVNTSGNTDTTNQRPNYNYGVSQYLPNPGPNGFLNPAAFSLPANGTYGDLGRNTFFGPGYAQEDLSLIKNTAIRENMKLQFRAEVFNVFNHTNFDEPQLTYNTTTFGVILNTFGRTLGSGVNRDIQLGLKLYF
jgi:outer membrane receptor protein involved in Fe transport